MRRSPIVAGTLALSVVIATLALTFLREPNEPSGEESWNAASTSYSAGPSGAKAFYRLLEELGLTASRLRRPIYSRLPPTSVLWVLTETPLGRVEQASLRRFIEEGGTVVAPPKILAPLIGVGDSSANLSTRRHPGTVTAQGLSLEPREASQSLEGMPEPDAVYAIAEDGAPIVAEFVVGEGRVVSLGVTGIFCNDVIGRSDNGVFLAKLAANLGESHVFDEFATGFGSGSVVSLLASAPYRWGVAQAALVVMATLIAIGRRRTPAEAPPSQRRREAMEHVDAVAHLWARADAAGLALSALMKGIDARARQRLPSSVSHEPFVDWLVSVRADLGPKARETWARAAILRETLHGNPDAAIECARQLKTLEEEGLKW